MDIGVQTQAIPAKNVVVINRQISEKEKKRRVKRKTLKDIPNATPDIKQLWRVYKTYDEPYLFRNIGEEENIIADIENAFGDKPTDVEQILKSFKENKGVSYSWGDGGDGGGGRAMRGGRLERLFDAGNLDDLFGSSEAQAVFGGRGQRVPSSSRVVGIDPDQARRDRGGYGSRIAFGMDAANVLNDADEGIARVGGRSMRMTGQRFANININRALEALATRARGTFGGGSGAAGSRTLSQAATRTQSRQLSGASSGIETPVRRYSEYGISEGLRTGPRISRAPRAT